MSEFEAFQQAVMTAYLEKKKQHELPSALEYPSPAKLRQYSLQVLAQRHVKTDDPALELFFDPEKKHEHIEDGVRTFDIEKFKPLINYLKGETSKTDEKNPKILAWLIDFQPRPYEKWRNARQGIEEGLIPELTGENKPKVAHTPRQDGVIKPEKETGSENPNPLPRSHRWVWYGTLVAAVLLGIYILTKPPVHECMYWKEDRYIAVSCQEKISGVNIIAGDEHLLKHFKKIMRPDTLTRDHVNKVWYSKIDNVVEFFTLPGFHPIHSRRSLKAATAHIIEQYAGKDD